MESGLLKFQLDPFHHEQLLVLLHQCIARFREDIKEGLFIERMKGRRDGEPADELGDQAVLQKVVRFDFGEVLVRRFPFFPPDIRSEPDRVLAHAPFDDLVQPLKCPAADEQNVLGVDVDETLFRMFASPLRRHAGDRSLQDLQ